MSAEGANLGQAKPDETLRQKDPVLDKLWKIRLFGGSICLANRAEQRYRRCNAWLVEMQIVEAANANLSGHITEARELFRAPFAFNRQIIIRSKAS